MYAGMAVVTAKLLADVGFGDAPDLPSAVEMFEALTGESGLGLIAENQVGFRQRRVTAQVPGFADPIQEPEGKG